MIKNSFSFKLFLAFLSFGIALLLFSFFSLESLVIEQNEKNRIDSIKKISEFKNEIIQDYLKTVDKKITAIANSIFLEKYGKSQKSKEELEDLLKTVLISDEKLINIRLLNFSGQEIVRVNRKEDKVFIVEQKNLQNKARRYYFKESIRLNIGDIWHSTIDLNMEKGEIEFPLKPVIRVTMKTKEGILVLNVNMNTLFNKLANNKDYNIYILDSDGYFLIHSNPYYNWSRYFNPSQKINKLYPKFKSEILHKNEYKTNEFYSKRVYLRNGNYLIFIIKYKEKLIEDFFKDTKESLYIIVCISLILALALAFFFSRPIIKFNKRLELTNADLDSLIKSKTRELTDSITLLNKNVIFYKMDKDGIITDISDALTEISGFSKAEIVGHTSKIFSHPDMDSRVVRDFNNAINDAEQFKGEVKDLKKDGSFYWSETFLEPNFDEEGNLLSFIVIKNNITDRKLIQELYDNIHYQIEQYNAIFDNAYSGIGLMDIQGNFKKVNYVYSELLGYSTSELLKMNCLDITVDRRKSESKEIMIKALEEGNVSHVEKICLHKNGKEVLLEMSLNLLPDKKYFVVVVNSLEDKRKLQELNQNLEQRVKEEVQKNIEKDKIHQEEQIKNAKLTSIGSLAAGITHEINTPLTYIKGNFEMMSYDIEDLPDSDIKERMVEDSEKIKDGIERIANIVESMREMSQSSKEVKENVNIYSTIITSLTMAYNRSKQIVKIYLNGKHFEIGSIQKDEFSFITSVQKQRVEQVWVIILNNALDELVKINNYEDRKFNINIFEENSQIVVKFHDNAGGIDEKIIDRIFEPFVSSKTHSGMGVGLNVAKKIIDEQNGEIIHYNEDGGAVFEVRFKCV